MYEVVKNLCSRSLIFLTNSFSFSFCKRCLNWAKWFWKKSSEVIPWGTKKYSIASTIHLKEWISLLEKGEVVQNTGLNEKNPHILYICFSCFAYLGLTLSTFSLQSQQLETYFFNGKWESGLITRIPELELQGKLFPLQLVIWQW